MEFEDKIKNKLLMRGFPNDKLLNNRGLIGATIDEVILMTVKNLAIHNVSQQSELLELLTEIANSDTLYSNTRHKLIAKKLLSSNCG